MKFVKFMDSVEHSRLGLIMGKKDGLINILYRGRIVGWTGSARAWYVVHTNYTGPLDVVDWDVKGVPEDVVRIFKLTMMLSPEVRNRRL